MKKIIFLFLSAAVVTLLSTASAKSEEDFFSANAAALNEQASGGNIVECFSQCKDKGNYHFYKCGPCEWTPGLAKGTSSHCIVAGESAKDDFQTDPGIARP